MFQPGYDANVSTPTSHCIESFPEQVVEEIAKLDLTDIGNEEENKSVPVDDIIRDDFDISPIPGYIISEHSVLIRRPASVSYNSRRSVTDCCESRRVLSAPPSLVVDAPNVPKPANFHGDAQIFPLDIDENEEDLINESFSNYFNEEVPDISGIELTSRSEVSGSISREAFLKSDQSIKEEIKTVQQDSLSVRKSVGSSNIVPFIDPDASMTTEALDNIATPDIGNERSFSILQHTIEEYSEVEYYERDHGIEEQSGSSGRPDVTATHQNSNHLSEVDVPISSKQNTLTSAVVEPTTTEENTNFYYIDTVNDSTYDAEAINDVEELAEDETQLSIHDIGSEEPNTNNDITPQNVRKHPSFNSPELPNHSIVERILKEECNIIVPPSHTIEQACAVGISRKFSLSLQNKTALWIKCSISIDEIGMTNGYRLPKNSLIIPPLAEEILPVCLCAAQDGLCLGGIELSANSVISGMLEEQYHSCKLQAIAKLPCLQLAPAQMDFGIQTENRESSYELRNMSEYELPLKIVLKSEGMDEVYSLSDPVSKYRTAIFALILQPRQVFLGHLEFCPYEQYTVCRGKTCMELLIKINIIFLYLQR